MAKEKNKERSLFTRRSLTIMDEYQIEIIRKSIETITMVEVCDKKIPVDPFVDMTDALFSSGSLESIKLAIANINKFPEMKEGDCWQVALKAIPESLESDIEEKYRDLDDCPVLIEKCIHLHGFHEKSGIQIILDCKEIHEVGFRWNLALRVFL